MSHGYSDINDLITVLIWPIMAIVVLRFAQVVFTSLAFLLSLNLPDWLFEPIFNVFGVFTFKILHVIALSGCAIIGLIKEWML